MENVIKVENLSKKFCISLKRSMLYGFYDVGRAILGFDSNSGAIRKNEFWAVNDVNFSLKKGETLGIIGANGSGKSTLLRLLTGIYPPDSGFIKTKGRVGSLIAVGAGFHPHMTGRENIYLNGSLLGMSKAEIDLAFDSIVEFAEIGDFLDAPVSTYSSGMYVRLGFSIAVHINPDILIVDEVLSVGDLNFRNKSMRKLGELRKNCATIFVSHELASVKKICDTVMIMEKGHIVFHGTADEAIELYQNKSRIETVEKENKKIDLTRKRINYESDALTVIDYGVYNEKGEKVNQLEFGRNLIIQLDFNSNVNIEKTMFGVGILEETIQTNIVYDTNTYRNISIGSIERGKKYRASVVFDTCNLTPGTYYLNLAIMDGFTDEVHWWKRGDIDDVFQGFVVNGLRIGESYVTYKSTWNLLELI